MTAPSSDSESPNRANRKLVVVLGPHRSGTSLCTAAVEALGADLGISSLYRNEENRKGFFEHPDLVAFNDRLISHLGGVWDNPGFFGGDALAAADIAGFEDEAREWISGLSRESPFVALKDPRICQLLPFWLRVFASAGYQPEELCFIHVVRDPVEVALSQSIRAVNNTAFYEFGRQVEEGAALWLSLTVQSLEYSEGCRNLFVGYQELLEDPQQQLFRMADFLGEPGDRDAMDEFVADFVDKSLHRSKPDQEARTAIYDCLPEVEEVYHILLKLTQGGTAKDVASIREIFHRDSTQIRFYLAQSRALSRLSKRCRQQGLAETELQDVRAELDKQVALYRRELDAQAANYKAALKEARFFVSSREEICRKLMESMQVLRTNFGGKGWPSISTRMVTNKMNSFARHRWMAFRTLLRDVFLRLNQRSPKIAHAIKSLVRPAVKLTERYVLRIRHELFVTGGQGRKLSEHIYTRYQQYEVDLEYLPLVTVIVPNYNHEPYLRRRLESIYAQGYSNFEVILMDDCSSDQSVSVLKEFHDKYPGKTILVVNDKNSGGVFYQWAKGLSLASGDIIWIAESDDYCSENFLETLVPYFQNEAVNLAYSRTTFVKGAAADPFWSIEEYLSDISLNRWNSAFVETAHKVVEEAFSIKNIIPNVSSALFRNQGGLDVLQDPVWQKMRTCGDWVLYLHLIRGGLLAYDPSATNYYRIHDKNTSVNSYSDDAFYQEHELVAKTVQRYFKVLPEVYTIQRQNLINHWKQTRDDFSEDRFNECYSIDRIREEGTERATNLLMAGYGFCAGGGETFPILLANLIKDLGYNVTFLDCAQEPRLPDIRKSLRPDIPVVSDLVGLDDVISDFGIDLIHSHHAWVDNTILELLPARTPVKTVVTLHGMYETIDDVALGELLPRLLNRTAKIVYTAEKNLTAIRSHGFGEIEKISRIDNALELYEFDPINRADIGVPEDAFLLTIVSRAIADKGWKEAIAAVEYARKTYGTDIHLVLIGEGPVYTELVSSELPEFVHLEGFRKNLRSYFTVSDLGFLPSRFEGESFPLVIIDCLHSGVPVLASSIGEIPYMLETEQGLAGAMFDLEDWRIQVEPLGELIGQLSRNPIRVNEMRSCVPAAAKKFNPHVLAEQYDAVYQGALSTRNSV